LLGSGLGRWDPVDGRIVVGGPTRLRYPPALDLGNASLVDDDFAYLSGCAMSAQDSFTSGCVLGRIDSSLSLQLFAGEDRWLATQTRADAVVIFDDGPWISSLDRDRSRDRLLHVFTAGFATSVSAHVAPRIDGPWTDLGSALRSCDLPSERGAYCQRPVVHPELADPRPDELAVTLRTGNADGDEYWTRLTRVEVP